MSIGQGKKRCKNGLWSIGKYGIPMESGECWTVESKAFGTKITLKLGCAITDLPAMQYNAK
jgi:hypothetical protein